MTTTAGHSFYIGPIGSFYNQVNDTGSWEPLVYRCIASIYILGARVAQWVRSLDLTAHTSLGWLSPIWRGFVPSFVNYKKGCTWLAVASDKVYQLLAQGRWFSPGTPTSSTTKTGHHDIAESGVKHKNSNSIYILMNIIFLSIFWFLI
jgi:hypothetical protein